MEKDQISKFGPVIVWVVIVFVNSSQDRQHLQNDKWKLWNVPTKTLLRWAEIKCSCNIDKRTML